MSAGWGATVPPKLDMTWIFYSKALLKLIVLQQKTSNRRPGKMSALVLPHSKANLQPLALHTYEYALNAAKIDTAKNDI